MPFFQNLVRPVAVAVLIDERVAARVDDHLDAAREFLHALDAVGRTPHFSAAHDGIGPHEDRNRCLDGILAHRQINGREGRVAFVFARVGARQSDLTEQNRHHGNGTSRLSSPPWAGNIRLLHRPGVGFGLKSRSLFPNEEAAYLAITNSTAAWKGPSPKWSAAMPQFALLFGERFTGALG